MKKIAKISLVAAIAVAGFTTANAQPLEEAIKNVDVTGSVVYRYNDYSNDYANPTTGVPGASTQTNNYKVGLNLSSKVNEDVKFNSRFLVASETGDFGSLKYDNGATNADNADINVGVALSHANFGYTGIKNTTVTVGKQGLATPYTVAIQADGNEQTGTGILALSTVGPVTLGAGYFNQTNLNKSTDAVLNKTKLFDAPTSQLDGSQDIAVVAAIATFAPVTVDAWYLTLNDTFDTYTVGAKAATKLAGIDLTADARYASLTFDEATAIALRPAISQTSSVEDSNSIAKLVLTADAGLIDGKLAYAKTGKDGGLTALDNDASTTLLGWNITANGKADADYYQAVLGIDILSNLNLSANYGNLKYIELANSTSDVEEEEVYGQLLYTMSKNLTTYVRYGTYTKDTTDVAGKVTPTFDDTRGRLQVKYTF